MIFKLCFFIALVFSSSVALADYKFPMPTESSRDGERACGKMANMDSDNYYDNVMAGKRAHVALAAQKEYYFRHSGPEDEASNDLIGAHLERIDAGQYRSKEQSTNDFYSNCLNSKFRKMLDKRFVR